MKCFKEMSRHHRCPVSLGGGNDSRNISVIPKSWHRAWHTLFENRTPDEIGEIINTYYLDPDYQFVVVKTNLS